MTTELLVSIGIGLLAIFVAWIIFILQKESKVISYLVVSNRGVVPKELQKYLDVTYRGEAVKDASVIILKLLSTGSRPIASDDFEAPIKFTFKDAERVVSALATVTRPNDLKPDLVLSGNTISIEPLLLNKHDLVELQLLVSGKSSKVTVQGRIKGGVFTQVSDSSRGVSKSSFLVNMPVTLVVAPLFLGVIFILISIWFPGMFNKWVTTIGYVVFFICFIISQYLATKLLSKRRALWRP